MIQLIIKENKYIKLIYLHNIMIATLNDCLMGSSQKILYKSSFISYHPWPSKPGAITAPFPSPKPSPPSPSPPSPSPPLVTTVPDGPATIAPPPKGPAPIKEPAETIPGAIPALMSPPALGAAKTAPAFPIPETRLPSGPTTVPPAEGPLITTPGAIGPASPNPIIEE